jgi:hypothetical protein
MTQARTLTGSLAALAIAACSSSSDSSLFGDENDGNGNGDGGEQSGDGGGDDGADDGSGDDGTGDAKFDVGEGETNGGGDDENEECGNVDILFVIDDSASMADNQQSLIASFAGFIEGIQERLAFADSYHVGIVTTDNYGFNETGCTNIGDLVTQTGGDNSSQSVCTPFASGARYLDQNEPDLAGKFACAAHVGTYGSDDEMAARAMLNALKPAVNGPGGCNEGFSRLDSLLVIVIITDEDDVPEPYGCDPDDPWNNPCDTTGSGGTPDDWYAEVLTHKANIPENIVVLTLLGQTLDNDCGAVVAAKLIGFTNRFGANGYTGDVCADSYDEFFTATLPIIDEACENFTPPP